AVRQVLAVVLPEAELKNLHPGNPDCGKKLPHVLRNDAQIFRHEWNVSQLSPRRVEEPPARTGHPLPLHRRLRSGRHTPSRREAAEVIDPDRSGETKRLLQACDPPGVAVLLHLVPAVERITPELARLGEGVRWNAGDELGLARILQREELLPRPDVGAVVRDVDREIAEDGDPET